MISLRAVFFGSVMTIAVVDSVAFAACESFTILAPGEHRVGHYSDLGEPGSSASDKLIGRRALVDKGGTPVGHIYWIGDVRVVKGHEKAPVTIWSNIIVLEDGEIFAYSPETQVEYSLSTHGDAAYTAAAATYSEIVGGTDAYENARGRVTFTGVGEKNDLVFDIEMTCE